MQNNRDFETVKNKNTKRNPKSRTLYIGINIICYFTIELYRLISKEKPQIIKKLNDNQI